MINSRKVLEQIISINPDLIPQYKSIYNRWYKRPEDEFLLAEFSAKLFFTLVLVSWLISSVFIVLALSSYLNEKTELLIGFSIVGMMFLILGLVFFISHSQEKKKYTEEEEKYKTALSNKLNVDRKIEYIRTFSNQHISSVLSNVLKDEKSDLKILELTISNLIYFLEDNKDNAYDIYHSNKKYDYRINEFDEVNAFKEVDSYLKYDEVSDYFKKVIYRLIECKERAVKEEEELLVHSLKSLSELVPNFEI